MTARQKDRKRVPRSPVKSGRPTAAAILKDVTEGSLANALLAYFGHPYEPITKLYDDGSVNKIACRLGVMAVDDPASAARATIRELTERHKWWRSDEGPTSNIYDGSTGFGRLFDLRGMEAAGQKEAAALVRQDIQRTQALYALLAAPGVVRGLNGQKVYSGPCVRAAGMRSLPSRVANPSTTPVASALLGGGTWHRDRSPLEAAIHELVDELVGVPSWAIAWQDQGQFTSTEWRESVEYALAGTRTKHPYLIQRYADGSVFSALLGPIGASSTAQLRGVIVRGAEAADAEAITPHVKERKVPASNASIAAGVVLEAWLEPAGKREGPIVRSKDFSREEPVLVVRLGPDAEPSFEGASA